MKNVNLHELYENFQPEVAENFTYIYSDTLSIETLLERPLLITVNHFSALENYVIKTGMDVNLPGTLIEDGEDLKQLTEAGFDVEELLSEQLIRTTEIDLPEVQQIADSILDMLDHLHRFIKNHPHLSIEELKNKNEYLRLLTTDEIIRALIHRYIDELNVYFPSSKGSGYQYYTIPKDGTMEGYIEYRFSQQIWNEKVHKVVAYWHESREAMEELYEEVDQARTPFEMMEAIQSLYNELTNTEEE